jgi:hypothetical protein
MGRSSAEGCCHASNRKDWGAEKDTRIIGRRKLGKPHARKLANEP